MSDRSQPASRSRLNRGSPLLERIVPASLILLALVTLVLILFALGVLAGIVRF